MNPSEDEHSQSDFDFHQKKSSIASDGSRNKIRIADVKGLFFNRKRWAFAVFICIFTLLPFLKIGGLPVIFIDILHRRFFLFGQTFNAQDFYLFFFFITGLIFTLFFITALFGRVWCGWACPQTVFLEGVYRKIERWIEGPRAEQLKLARSPWHFKKITKFITKHILFLFVSAFIANIFLSYFLSMEQLWTYIQDGPKKHMYAFTWMLSILGIIHLNFVWFREQLCLIVCPYGRFQSALTDDDTYVIGYDEKRGEPRGKLSDPNTGDCINCHRCVDVCPTGIDIREGLQLECVGCANCIDACDEIMLKVGKPQGLVRYDSYNGFHQKKKTFIRGRVIAYAAFLFVGFLVMSFTISQNDPFEANILRLQDSPYTVSNGIIRNSYTLHLVNKTAEKSTFEIIPPDDHVLRFILPLREVTLESLADKNIPIFVEMDQDHFKTEFPIILEVLNQKTKEVVKTEIMFLGPQSN
jgi:cytochrome c oxidase accessory protein FixG